ncbi:MAG TPA: hypothetical protein VK475_06310 [Pyrinomonadaceae bacterium]|nr:hypothetical protein [Pyrinomonadaceae bacterium]
MADDKKRDWVDTVAKLLIPLVIFGATFMFSYQKDKSDRANQQFERESGILKLVASSNDSERKLGVTIIDVQSRAGKLSPEALDVVRALVQGRPTDASTQTAQTILVRETERNPELGKQIQPTPANHVGSVYIQIARDDQRAQASALRDRLTKEGLTVPGIELVTGGTSNTYVRYFSPGDNKLADKILELMKSMGFNVLTQDFTSSNQGKIPAGQIEVWIGEKQGPLVQQ